jgi:hypothetical protein
MAAKSARKSCSIAATGCSISIDHFLELEHRRRVFIARPCSRRMTLSKGVSRIPAEYSVWAGKALRR